MEALAASGLSQTEVIARMRKAGIRIGVSIELMARFYNMPHHKAKEMVHFSDAWSDMRANNDELHETAFAALKEAGFEEVSADSLRVAS